MKHSNTWFASILIASALLLSAARNATAEPSRNPNTRKVETASDQRQPTGSPIAASVDQPTAYTTSTEGGHITYNYNGDFKYVAPPPAPESGWKKFGDIANVASAIAVAFFTAMLWHVSRQQWQAINEQAKIGNKSLILQFRPKLIVRNVVVKRSENTMPPRPLFERGMPVYGQFYISNIGGTPARIIEIGCWVEWYVGELPMERPYEGKNGQTLSVPIVLQPSQSTPWTFMSERVMGDEANNILLNNDRWGIIVLGWVAYKDDAGIERRTAFCRRWSVSRQRFMPVEDTDYQHEE